MRQLINYFIKYPISGNVLMVIIFIFGILGLLSLRSTFFPEAETRLIVVQVTYPGASPEEIEEGIVNKIEDNLKGTTGVDRVTSVSSENSGRVTVEIKTGNDIDEVLQEVKNAVDQISSFPANMEAPIIFKQETLTLALNFAVKGNISLQALKKYAREIESDLLAVDGISKVELSGFPDEEIEIAVREADLRAYGLTFEQIRQAIAAANLETTGGTIRSPDSCPQQKLLWACPEGHPYHHHPTGAGSSALSGGNGARSVCGQSQPNLPQWFSRRAYFG